jgi:hypothetical protein
MALYGPNFGDLELVVTMRSFVLLHGLYLISALVPSLPNVRFAKLARLGAARRSAPGKSSGTTQRQSLWSGRRDEVQARCDERNITLLVSREEWPLKITGKESKLSMLCRACDTTVETTTVSNFMYAGKFGCACYSAHAKKWSGRRGEVQDRCDERNIELLTSLEEWPQKVTGDKSNQCAAACAVRRSRRQQLTIL